MNILIIGHARHGKDTVAEYIELLFGLSFKSSSLAASEIFLYAALKEKYGYQTPEECYEDRMNRREEWHNMICEYNTPDKARLAKDILATNDMYVGMRSDEEFQESMRQGLFDLVLGVFNPRKPLESPKSFSINMWSAADLVIPNDQGKKQLYERIKRLEPLISPGQKFISQTVERAGRGNGSSAIGVCNTVQEFTESPFQESYASAYRDPQKRLEKYKQFD